MSVPPFASINSSNYLILLFDSFMKTSYSFCDLPRVFGFAGSLFSLFLGLGFSAALKTESYSFLDRLTSRLRLPFASVSSSYSISDFSSTASLSSIDYKSFVWSLSSPFGSSEMVWEFVFCLHSNESMKSSLISYWGLSCGSMIIYDADMLWLSYRNSIGY